MTDRIDRMKHPLLTQVLTIARSSIRSISSVEVGGETHWLGEQREFAEASSASYADLEQFNESRLRRYEKHRLFKPFDDGRMSRDPALRDRFVSALYVWSVYFQRMLYARQSVCIDPPLRELYAGHLREEFGHDSMPLSLE